MKQETTTPYDKWFADTFRQGALKSKEDFEQIIIRKQDGKYYIGKASQKAGQRGEGMSCCESYNKKDILQIVSDLL